MFRGIQFEGELIKMEHTKGNYTCKVCGKVSIGAGAHHSRQRRCVTYQMKREATPQAHDGHLRSENQYRVQGVTTVLPPTDGSGRANVRLCGKTGEYDGQSDRVFRDTSDVNYDDAIQCRDGAEDCGCIERKMEPETTFQHMYRWRAHAL